MSESIPKERNKKFMKYIIILICIPFLLTSCHKQIDSQKKDDEVFTISQITTNYDTLIKRVKKKGNKDAYDELFYGFKDSNKAGRTDSLMIYSEIMAEKFNYEKAYFDYFEAFGEKNDIKINFSDYSKIDISKLDKNTKKKAIDWLNNMLREKIIKVEQFDSIKKQ